MSRGAKAMVLTMWTLIPSDNQAGAAKATAAPCSLARSDTTLPMGGSRGAEGKLVHSFKKKNYSSLKTPSFPTKTPIVATRMHTPPRGTPLLPDSDHPDSSVWTLEPERPSGATTGKVAILTALGVEPRTARALSFVGRSLNHLVKVSL